jgi:hypothetical protein
VAYQRGARYAGRVQQCGDEISRRLDTGRRFAAAAAVAADARESASAFDDDDTAAVSGAVPPIGPIAEGMLVDVVEVGQQVVRRTAAMAQRQGLVPVETMVTKGRGKGRK